MPPKIWFIPFVFILFMLTGCGGSDSASFTGLQVTASNNPVPAGFQSKLTATAFYSDGNSNTTDATWESSDEVKAIVDKAGLVTALASGNVTITATTSQGAGTFLLEITPATLSAIQVNPVSNEVPLGINISYEAIGFFSDGSSHNINDEPDLVWKSTNENVAIINKETARSETRSEGATIFTAVLGISSNDVELTVNHHVLQSITITPERFTMPFGTEQPFIATGHFSDGNTLNISEDVKWSSTSIEHTVLAPVNETGLFESVGLGNASVSATYNVDDDVKITSDNQPLVVVEQMKVVAFIVESPITDDSQPLGKEVQFKATATFDNGHSYDVSGYELVDWQSNDADTATVTPAGLVKGLKLGSVTITAKAADDSWLASETVEIKKAVVDSLHIVPVDDNLIITKGKTQQYDAFTRYTDGTLGDNVEESNDFTWSVVTETQEDSLVTADKPPAASITAQGKLTYDSTGGFPGQAKIKGDYEELSGVAYTLLPNPEQISVPSLSPTQEFIGVLSKGEADILAIAYSGILKYKSQGDYVTMTQSQAVSYCDGLLFNGNNDWRLPKSDELQALWESEDGDDDDIVFSAGWAFSTIYWSVTVNGSGHEAVSLIDSTITAANDDEAYYVSCVRSVQ